MDLLSAVLNAVLPQRCLLCDQPGGEHSLCAPCREDLPWLRHACQHCAEPLLGEEALCENANPPDFGAGGLHGEEALCQETSRHADPPRERGDSVLHGDEALYHNEVLCGRCLTQPPSFDRCIAAFRYASPVDRLIGRFKNQRQLTAGKILSLLFADQLRASAIPLAGTPASPDLITPVPLHWRRQLRRGFNQAAFVAETLARELKIPLAAVARRRGATSKQQKLNRRQRLHNLDRAFAVDSAQVWGRYVVIVDDVVTTGATTEALAALLKQAGARRVDVWALARTPAPHSLEVRA